jgi:hypothetical protein
MFVQDLKYGHAGSHSVTGLRCYVDDYPHFLLIMNQSFKRQLIRLKV